MADVVTNSLDLELAFKRVKRDSDVFVEQKQEFDLIEIDRSQWLDQLKIQLDQGQYYPISIYVFDVPKGDWAVRPAAILSVRDKVVYTACIGTCLEAIAATLKVTSDHFDYSYKINKNNAEVDWLLTDYGAWGRFNDVSLQTIAHGFRYIVLTDVTGYYENIDIATLMSDIKHSGAPTSAVTILTQCLQKWAQVPGRGIPQGHSASNILGRLYLNNVHANLSNMGYTHYSYMDDIRIFCESYSQAKRAIVDLTRLFRQRGLNIQSAKSSIYPPEQAIRKIDSTSIIISEITQDLKETIVLQALRNPYLSNADAETILADNPEHLHSGVLHTAYNRILSSDCSKEFDKSLFKYVIKRLGQRKDDFAVEHCTTLLEVRPEVTQPILDYFKNCDVSESISKNVLAYLHSPEAVYTYQKYQLLKWMGDTTKPSQDILQAAREFAFDANQPFHLRSVARQVLGKVGLYPDLERLEGAYHTTTDPRERSDVIIALALMEKGRRNAFLSRVEHDDDTSRAVKLVRTGNTPR